MASGVVDRFASVANGRLIFDFGDGDVLVLNGLTSIAGLAAQLDLV